MIHSSRWRHVFVARKPRAYDAVIPDAHLGEQRLRQLLSLLGRGRAQSAESTLFLAEAYIATIEPYGLIEVTVKRG